MLYSAFVRFLKKCAIKMIINKQTNKQTNRDLDRLVTPVV